MKFRQTNMFTNIMTQLSMVVSRDISLLSDVIDEAGLVFSFPWLFVLWA